jgi:hypothetical protein
VRLGTLPFLNSLVPTARSRSYSIDPPRPLHLIPIGSSSYSTYITSPTARLPLYHSPVHDASTVHTYTHGPPAATTFSVMRQRSTHISMAHQLPPLTCHHSLVHDASTVHTYTHGPPSCHHFSVMRQRSTHISMAHQLPPLTCHHSLVHCASHGRHVHP